MSVVDEVNCWNIQNGQSAAKHRKMNVQRPFLTEVDPSGSKRLASRTDEDMVSSQQEC